MNKYKIIVVLVLTLAGIKPSGAQQNIQFTQYIFNSLSVNPAYAGYKEEWFAQMAMRSQWVGVKDAPQTGQVSIDGVLDPVNKRLGLGLVINADQLGAQSANSAYLNFAYRLRLNSDDTRRLTFGLGAGVTQYGLDYSKLSPIDANDQTVSSGIDDSFIPDVRFGVYYSSPKFYIGASGMDLLSASSLKGVFGDSGSNLNLKHDRHVYLMSGLLFDLNEEVKLRPSFLVKEDFKGPTSIDINSMVIFRDKFWVGGSYRSGAKIWRKDYSEGKNVSDLNSVSGVVQFYVSRKLRLGYSYDYALSQLSSQSSGSHEISLGLTFPKHSTRLLSPRFF